MYAEPGDWLVVETISPNEPRRRGLILEVHHVDGGPPYVVRWTDTGTESLVFPGPDSHVLTAADAHTHA